jgi:hypothetical protein
MIKQLKAWLKRPGNSQIKIACNLGYKSSHTIRSWLIKGKIPGYIEPRLKDILK